MDLLGLGDGDGGVIEHEQVLCVIGEVFCYRVKAMATADGFRCADWGLDAPMLTGRLRVIGRGEEIFCRVLKPDGAVFAETEPVKAAETPRDRFVTPAVDSSRYYVIRLLNPRNGQRAPLGIGFRERSSAFDFTAAVDDFCKKARRNRRGGGGSDDEDDGAGGGAELLSEEVAAMDLGLADGQTIRVKLGGAGGRSRAKPRAKPSSGGGGLSLAAPPKAEEEDVEAVIVDDERRSKKKKKKRKQERRPDDEPAEPEDDEWGDFQ